MTCTFYHNPLGCMVSYCYYPRNGEITCPVKKEHIAEVGEIFRESPGSETGRTAYTRYDPRRRGSHEDYPKQ